MSPSVYDLLHSLRNLIALPLEADQTLRLPITLECQADHRFSIARYLILVLDEPELFPQVIVLAEDRYIRLPHIYDDPALKQAEDVSLLLVLAKDQDLLRV